MAAFNVGDVITGKKENNGYSITNSKSLLLVINTYDNDNMRVKILCHSEESNQISEEYDVWNDADTFTFINVEEYFEKYPNCYNMGKEIIKDLINEYVNTEVIEPYVLSDEMRKELLEEMKSLLEKYHYHPTDDGLNKILDEWCKNKAGLIHMFEKHPNYNGKFQIVFDHDFDRVIDPAGALNFRAWLINSGIKDTFKKEVIIGEYSYNDLYHKVRQISNIIDIMDNYSYIHTINEKDETAYRAEFEYFDNLKDQYHYGDNIVIDGRRAYQADLYKNLNKYQAIISLLDTSYVLEQFIGDVATRHLKSNFPDAKIRKGQRMSRAINKVLCMIGADKLDDYNKEFAKFADSVNPLKIKRHTVISIHPIDYLTMSFGNSWSSCHTIDKKNDRHIDSSHNYRGCNSSGTESYMLDKTSSIFYTVDAKYDGNKLELEDKINRCMFHYYDNRLVQGRVYPQSNDTGANDLYKDIREVVQKVYADMLDVPNYWTNQTGMYACESAVHSTGTHYRDYLNYDNCNVSTLKDDRDYHGSIEVGHNPICPHCGKTHTWTDSIECRDCYND